MSRLEYPVLIEPVADEDGGGYVAIVPDLPGCACDGETPEQALKLVQAAIAAWLKSARDNGQDIPEPSEHLAVG